jgi:hypothetical protein
VVARDADSVRGIAAFGSTTWWRRAFRTTTAYGDVNFFTVIMVVMTTTDNAFGSTVKLMAEGMVVT